MSGLVHQRIEEGVLRIVLANEEKRNAMSLEMWEALGEAVRAAGADESVRVVLLRGSGDSAFVSGSDVSGFGSQRSTPEATLRYNETVETALHGLATCEKPTLAAISGYCIGGGLSIAAACDLRLACDGARFAVPAARIGIGYSRRQIERLQALVGHALVRDLVFTGRRIDSVEAVRRGLVDCVEPAGTFWALVDERLRAIAANAPLTIRAAKRASLNAMRDLGGADDRAVDEAIAACFDSEDYQEGIAAFAQKRRPAFRGR